MNDRILFVSIKGPDGIVFEGQVDALSSVNEVGPFDVLPLHENFIALIKDKLILYNKKEKVKELAIDGGVIHISRNIAHIFLGIEAIHK